MAPTPSPYSFRVAHERGHFIQHPLVDHEKFGSLAKKRGIGLGFGTALRETLERLDEAGALRPVAFQRGTDLIFRDEVAFTAWEGYRFEEDGWRRLRALYSSWQLLYTKEALDLGFARFPVEWLLDTTQRRRLRPGWRAWCEKQIERWRTMDDTWRATVLLLVRIQNRYFPSARGTLTTTRWTAPLDLETGQFVDYSALARAFDPEEALGDVGLSVDEVKRIHTRLAFTAISGDPLGGWGRLARMAPYEERQTLAGPALRVQDYYDAAAMLRLFYRDLTGDLLPQPDELVDTSDGSWRRRVFGHGPSLSYTRQDLKAELQLHGLYPHLVHLVVEGETERLLFEQLIAAIGLNAIERGVSISTFEGVGNAGLRREILRVARSYSRFPVLVADREGDIEREVDALKRDGLLSDETAFLWDKSLEEDNFTHDELVELAKAAAQKRGGRLRLTGRTLRKEHQRRCSQVSQGLAKVLCSLARNPQHGSVQLSKIDLAEEMAALLLDEIRGASDLDELGKRRPVIGILLAILRTT